MYAPSQTSEPLKSNKSLVCMDVDGTLCRIDSFTRFVFYALPWWQIVWRGLPVLPWIVAYFLKLYPAHFMRPRLFHCMFRGTSFHRIDVKAQSYAKWMLTQLNPEVYEALKNHIQQQHDVVLVSAGVDVYLKHFAKRLGVKLMCSQAEIKHGKLTGRYLTADCSNEQKVIRIQASYDLRSFDMVYAYGNSDEDVPMLKMADVAYWVDESNSLSLKSL